MALMFACDAVDDGAIGKGFNESKSTSSSVLVGSPDGGVGRASQARQCSSDGGTGECELPNAEATCAGGRCVLRECLGAFKDCDNDSALDAGLQTGCEATLDSAEHCGMCNAACKLPNAVTSCAAGQCRLTACDDWFGDCDNDPKNGCETPLDTINHCGECGARCDAVENGIAGCIYGRCGVANCAPGFGNCDGDPDACETELVSLDHCNDCDRSCTPDSATGTCETGTCVVEDCEDGRFDCNGLASDGCEATLTSLEHCGECGKPCSPPQATRPMCAADESPARCGVDHSCWSDDEDCVEDAPENGCEAGFADCDGVADNGCETPLDTIHNCQGCGITCRVSNAITSCRSGSCEVTGCEPGYGQCGSDVTCLPLANDKQNCGACGRACDSDRECHGGECTSQTCAPGTADCDGLTGNRCETMVDSSNTNCGLCQTSCEALDRARGECANGKCEIVTCGDRNYADCDGLGSTGCETDLRTLGNCGGCGKTCAVSSASETCEDRTCQIATCDPGRGDCDGVALNGCEKDVTLPASCGACDANCEAGEHLASAGCADGQCELTCAKDYADCDGRLENGCEADLRLEGNCNECGADCTSLARVVAATCGGNGCRDLECEVGYADCDGDASNGCERSLSTNRDCGGCDVPCAPARGGGTCRTGTCRVWRCDAGFDDCNQQAEDGCESSLASASSCGKCESSCTPGLGCENGSCKCESIYDCPGDQECCNGTCVDTDSVCSIRACSRLEAGRPLLHCGGCDIYCPLRARFFCCAN